MQTPLSQITDLTLALIRCELQNAAIDEKTKALLAHPEILADLYEFSSKHDLSHLIAAALSKNKLLDQSGTSEKFQKQMMLAVYRHEQKKYELEQLERLFEAEKIPHMPLKGSVIQQLYPSAWFRTSCDIDVLVRREDTERAIDALSRNGYVRQDDATTHDHSFATPLGVHLELHYSLDQGEQLQRANAVLDAVWERSAPAEAAEYCYDMSWDDFVFYHVAHMAKHFIAGGCGIRPFIDLRLLSSGGYCDGERLRELLDKAGLTVFYETAIKLTRVWFEGLPHHELTAPMSAFVLTGGVYGSAANSAAVKAAKGEGKLRSFLKLTFLSRQALEILYPELCDHPILLPFCQIRRWLGIFDPQRRKKISELTAARNSVSAEKMTCVSSLLEGLELK